MFGFKRKTLKKLPKPKREISMSGVREPSTSTGEALLKYKPPSTGATDASRLNEIFKESQEMSKNRIVDTEGNSREEIKVAIDMINEEYFNTKTYLTIREINQSLNSDMDFINIGNVIVKRESVVDVYKVEEKES